MELVMDQRIVWDANSLKQVDQAKATIMKWKRAGYKILTTDGKLMERFRPQLEEVIIKAEKTGKKVLKILCEKGDERIVWDKEDGNEALQAKDKFVQMMNKGYKAYSVDSDGKKQARIEEFDVDAEEILMVPPTAKG